MNPATYRAVLPHNLAACYQEMYSLAAQLSTGKEIGDPDRFRSLVRTLLKQSDAAAKDMGYPDDDVIFARFAVVALLDDIILNSTAGTFLNWANNPLAIQLFQKGGAGVRFFNHLNELLQRTEDPRTLELLEVHLQCLLLGFRGQFGRNHDEQLYAWREPIAEKLQRVLQRGRTARMGGEWRPEAGIHVAAPTQYRTQRARSVALVLAMLVPLVFVVYWLLLGRGITELAHFVGK